MSLYRYRAVDYSGQTLKGTIESGSIEAAVGELGAKGLYLVSILESNSPFPGWRRSFARAGVGRADVLALVQGLSVMVGAGMPIVNALDDLIATTSKPAMVAVIEDIRLRLEHGSSISAALEAHGELFPGIVRTMVAVGEETGALPETLNEAAEHLARMQRLKGVLRKALTYPVMALVATLGALAFWLVFVIPNLAASLKGLGVKLPVLTVVLIRTSDWATAHWKGVLVASCLLAVLPLLAGTHPHTRYLRDRLLIKTPVVKGILLNKLMVVFAEQFGMLVKGGVKIERLFDLVAPSMGNEYYRANLDRAKENILHGGRISDSLAERGILPALVLSKIRIGEATGTLDNQLHYLAKWYAARLDDSIDNLGKVVEPLVIAVIGGLFALIAVGLLLPIYELVSKLGKT